MKGNAALRFPIDQVLMGGPDKPDHVPTALFDQAIWR